MEAPGLTRRDLGLLLFPEPLGTWRGARLARRRGACVSNARAEGLGDLPLGLPSLGLRRRSCRPAAGRSGADAARQAVQHLQTAADRALPRRSPTSRPDRPGIKPAAFLRNDVRAAVPECVDRILPDVAWPALATLLADAEVRGHEPPQLLKEVAAQRSWTPRANPPTSSSPASSTPATTPHPAASPKLPVDALSGPGIPTWRHSRSRRSILLRLRGRATVLGDSASKGYGGCGSGGVRLI